ncbi:hypothetical protein [Cupriavidus sp. SW-Y-13]|nr:hypothetical protein [Cupriavidus sp. SW-Y-13]MWL91890.1 hypothetical protein [Cupriavidus sp. SW-Y-13]
MERGQDTFTCPSDWSGNCGYSGKGQFKVCAPEGNQICGYTAKVLSRKNGRYGMYPIDKNCVSGAISSKGSGNPADRWGGTMVVQITTYSYLVGQPPKQVAIDKYCKIERDGNPPQGGCGCVGPVMMCNGQASGVCSTTISTP